VIDESQRCSLWGQVFEIAVKRGVLTGLLASDVRKPDHLSLGAWTAYSAAHVYGALARALCETDPNQKARTRETARHLFDMGMALGQTAMREYLRMFKNPKGEPEDYEICALWCPFQLPRIASDVDAETEDLLAAFCSAFGAACPTDRALARKGYPVRADFLLWLEPRSAVYPREFLCLEFSLNGPAATADYREPDAHLDELGRYVWYVDSRSVFSRVCAEISGEGFELSPTIAEYLPAFTGRDKPLYKLCQAASYVDRSMHWLKSRGFGKRPFNARALSITQNGFESLSAQYFHPDQHDPRVNLMATLGRAYRNAEKIPDDGDDDLDITVQAAFEYIRKALPKPLRHQLAAMPELPRPGSSLAFDVSEDIGEYRNPMAALPWEAVLGLGGDHACLTEHFGRDAAAALIETLPQTAERGAPVPLRDLHAAAIKAGLSRARTGELAVLGLEGNPGIGKTTAAVDWLKAQDRGYLFVYVSPRVIINDDVTGKLACNPQTNEPTGVLTVTTNARLIGTARNWYDDQVRQAKAPPRHIDSAVVADGVADLRCPHGSTLILAPGQREELELAHTEVRFRKHSETERQDRVVDARSPGVLRVLAKTARMLLEENPCVNQVMLTAAIQGYRDVASGKTTLQALSELFRSAVTTTPGRRERADFARRIPTIVVMVDELTGDGAGAPFIHTVARWLDDQFIAPFLDAPLFTVILVVSDASLGNEVVLDRYLNSGEAAPDKVLVSGSVGNRPFRMTVSLVRLGGRKRRVLHVMANSYPATSLAIDYRVRLDVVVPGETPTGKMQTVRQAIVDQQGEALLNNALREIERALAEGADQVIFFAQDKAFLRALQTLLTARDEQRGEPALREHQVAILDSSVPAVRRKEIIVPGRRDGVKVFLMTSSGARGISFPKTDWIIALMPRFNVEAALMEVAQLIYRGRGSAYTADDGERRLDGDWKDRRLVMLLQDFLALPSPDAQPEPRRWLRQVSDLLTFLVMLRSTILTRITGDAGLDGQRLAVVPVGSIGSEEMLSTMSAQVRRFRHECQVLLHDVHVSRDLVGLLVHADAAVRRVFSQCALIGTARQRGFRSTVRLTDMRRFSDQASADNTPLLPDPREEPHILLPDHIYCVGPFWLESWGDLDKEERFIVEGWLTDVNRQVARLYGELKRISEERRLPSRLRRPAEELYRLLAREKEEATREFSTVKTLDSRSTWLAVPVDYPRFWREGPDGCYPSLGDHEEWRDALACCLATGRDVLPVIAQYQDIPYAAAAGVPDPARFSLVFDDRYLAASSELNLLNIILLTSVR
jgi:Helicase conserved C-terminal domain